MIGEDRVRAQLGRFLKFLGETWVFGIFILLIRKLPLMSEMPDVSWDAIRKSIIEVLFLIVTATIPIWLGAVLMVLFPSNEVPLDIKNDFYSRWIENVKLYVTDGSLILYCASLLAPVLYMAFDYSKGEDGRVRPFPSRVGHGLGVLIVIVISAGFFSRKMTSSYMYGDAIIEFSYYLSLASLYVLFVAHCYKNHNLNPAGKFVENTLFFAHGYSRHREDSSGGSHNE